MAQEGIHVAIVAHGIVEEPSVYRARAHNYQAALTASGMSTTIVENAEEGMQYLAGKTGKRLLFMSNILLYERGTIERLVAENSDTIMVMVTGGRIRADVKGYVPTTGKSLKAGRVHVFYVGDTPPSIMPRILQ